MTQDRSDISRGKGAPKPSREERLAEALRANLQKRKAQARARKNDAATSQNDKNEGS
ncbi:hypothetical protein DT23_14645 [Thioclava indica]|uniref:Uncharacterized protein n=1 Tax=Thioclava indica TaxID=1353528 RepID=A0A074KEP8_9RHOB|nr:hypothetical protein DT23_14645 [Thioclava indica]